MSSYVGFKIGKAVEHKAYISEYYCGGCGYPVSDHDSYCPECGGAFRKEDATERIVCCKDCKFSTTRYNLSTTECPQAGYLGCKHFASFSCGMRWSSPVSHDGFCSWGEKGGIDGRE